MPAGKYKVPLEFPGEMWRSREGAPVEVILGREGTAFRHSGCLGNIDGFTNGYMFYKGSSWTFPGVSRI